MFKQDVAEVVVNPGEVRAELDGRSILGDRLVWFPLAEQGTGKIGVILDVARLEPESRAVFRASANSGQSW
jgi:hypothetical protein